MRKSRAIFATLIACGLTFVVQPADAGFLDSLFGGFIRRAPPPPPPSALPEMSPSVGRISPQGGDNGEYRPRAESGSRSAYCVRTCDGHYFPVQARVGMSAAQMCSAFCPASETRLYAGGGIDYATAPDGTHYRDLPKAFLYRKQLVSGCTCNGKDVFGLARIELKNDPTLARGDIVATKDGLVSVAGRDADGPQFTAVATNRSVPQAERDRLAGTRVARPGRNGSPPTFTPDETTGGAPADD
jgi:hypothetical protein